MNVHHINSLKGTIALAFRSIGSKISINGKRIRPRFSGPAVYLIVLLGFLSEFAPTAHAEAPLWSFPYQQKVIACEFESPRPQPPRFNEDECEKRQLAEINPQKTNVWVQIQFDQPPALESIAPPYGLFIFGKTSSSVFLNGEHIGSNGVPGTKATEVVGKMDSVFYVQNRLLKDKGNELQVHFSSSHSLLNLQHPIHFIGLGHYGDPRRFVQQGRHLGLALVGAFLLGTFYFLFLGFGSARKWEYRMFSALCLIAVCQLGAEMCRGLILYDYPWHDVRLIVVTGFSFLFGMSLLIYSSIKVAGARGVHWVYACIILGLFAITFAPGFDTKTTAGIFVPLLVSLGQLLFFWVKERDSQVLQWFSVQLIVTVTIIVVAESFHELIHFLIVGALLGYLFVQQAKDRHRQEEQIKQDQALIAKLEFKLEQNAEEKQSSKIDISIAGKTEYIDTNKIAYCKASGDYVELHLNNKEEKLFSGSLKQLEALLPPVFIKVHRSYLVNLNSVASLLSKPQSESKSSLLLLSNDQSVPVSRRLLPSVRESLKQVVNSAAGVL